jgi:hypothetical protein
MRPAIDRTETALASPIRRSSTGRAVDLLAADFAITGTSTFIIPGREAAPETYSR